MRLKKKLGNGDYDFLARTYHMPSSRTIGRHSGADRMAKDGVMFETLRQQKEMFDRAHPAAGPIDFVRHGSLTWDSTSVIDRVKHDSRSMMVTGFADEDWNRPNIIEAALNSIQENVDRLDDDDYQPEPEHAEHFFVFYFTTWDADSKKTQFLVARYAVKKLSNEYLHDQVRTIIAALYAKGFVVTAITGDGASENRSLFKTLGTLTVGDLIAKDVFPQDWLAEAFVPLHFPVAFYHPSLPMDKKVLIFIMSDMPHLIKKFVNALERSFAKGKKTKLMFLGKKLSLRMIRAVWKLSEELGGLRQSKLTENHFWKDANVEPRLCSV